MYKYEHTETTFDLENKKSIKVADWTVVSSELNNNRIIIQKITPETKYGDIVKKVVKVENSNEFVYKVLKTKIKAIGGAKGLIDWMNKDDGLFECKINQILNYAWNEMRGV